MHFQNIYRQAYAQAEKLGVVSVFPSNNSVHCLTGMVFQREGVFTGQRGGGAW